MSAPRQYPIHPALTAPDLVWGAERSLVWPLWIMVWTVVYVGFFSAFAWVVIGLLVGGISQWGLVLLAKHDPLWTRIYLRSRRYRAYYPAHSRVNGK
jgi:type IV secretory pathway TrbD component